MMSASLWIGALELWASSTTLIIFDKAVSRPTLMAFTCTDPFLFNVEPITVSPMTFSTGMDSPVNIDSSMDVLPLMTSPSTGIFSPGLMIKVSPSMTSSSGTMVS